jgi:DNA-binding NarL/FixJ family response regulator
MDAGEIAVSRALASAASGFVHLGIPPDRFLDTIRRAASGEEVLEGVPLEAVARIVGRLDRRVAIDGFLTAREREVLAVASEGLTAREIALRLGVRERTVTTHLGHIYRKLGTRGRLAAIAAVNGGGLLDGTIPARVLPVGSVP